MSREQVERTRRLHDTRTRGSTANHSINWSRRAGIRSTSRVTRLLRTGERLRAAAFCEIDATFDVECPCSVLAAATTSFGPENPAAAPSGHRIGLRGRPGDQRPIAHRDRSAPSPGCAARRRRSASRSTDRRSPRCRAWRSASAIAARSSSEITAPVGFAGELMMTAFVLGVIAAMIGFGMHLESVFGLRVHDHRMSRPPASPARGWSASTARA